MTIHLPTINASLNALSGIFLFIGWLAIKRQDRSFHQTMMLCAMASSTLFLISYLYYHFTIAGVTRYPHTGILKTIYLTILITHTILAAIVPFAAIAALWHALKGNFPKHTAITRWLYPMWIYVSVTGVVVYFMLYIFK